LSDVALLLKYSFGQSACIKHTNINI